MIGAREFSVRVIGRSKHGHPDVFRVSWAVRPDAHVRAEVRYEDSPAHETNDPFAWAVSDVTGLSLARIEPSIGYDSDVQRWYMEVN